MVVAELPISCTVIHMWTHCGSLHHASVIVVGIDRNYDPPLYSISFERNNQDKTVEHSSLEPSGVSLSLKPAVDLACPESIDSMPSAGADVEEMLSTSNPERVGAAAANEYGLPRRFGRTLGKRPSSPTGLHADIDHVERTLQQQPSDEARLEALNWIVKELARHDLGMAKRSDDPDGLLACLKRLRTARSEKGADNTGACSKDGGPHNKDDGATTSAVLPDLGPVGKKQMSLDPRVLRDLDGEATLKNIEKAMKSSSQHTRLLSRLGKQVAHALVRVHACTHKCTHPCTHIGTHSRTHACTHGRTHGRMHGRTITGTVTRARAHTHMYTHMVTYVHRNATHAGREGA